MSKTKILRPGSKTQRSLSKHRRRRGKTQSRTSPAPLRRKRTYAAIKHATPKVPDARAKTGRATATITFSCPPDLYERINDLCQWRGARSHYISTALREWLDRRPLTSGPT